MTNASSYRIDSASRVIAATPKAIYESFINPAALSLWLPPKGMSAYIEQFDCYEGGTYKITLTYEEEHTESGKTSKNTDLSQGKFLKLIPNTKIVLSVNFGSENPSFSGEMIQTWYLEAVLEGTKVTIVCENVPVGIQKEDHDVGLNSTLENLAGFAEKMDE